MEQRQQLAGHKQSAIAPFFMRCHTLELSIIIIPIFV
jgi:hypothetical protein